ncbi:hypothetical protein RHMOL_Rhmol13G0018100 [Rhododendron molle]|uniref:Uncharacterized protein n=1 Tax=Rhododendron molle TaxID=49168 RepID=A0ACC0L316_RHOML|nr:hypothetical protein RHMOL_Rhmol13G0018100 [Rhododendron molle]
MPSQGERAPMAFLTWKRGIAFLVQERLLGSPSRAQEISSNINDIFGGVLISSF